MELAISVVIFGLIFNNLVAKKLIKTSYFLFLNLTVTIVVLGRMYSWK